MRSSTQRVHALATTTSTAGKPNHQNTRDIYLLKHMLVIFVVFIIGWTPVYIDAMIDLDEKMPLWIIQLLQIPPVISSIIIILDLFLYNHDLTQYLKDKLFKCLHSNQNQ